MTGGENVSVSEVCAGARSGSEIDHTKSIQIRTEDWIDIGSIGFDFHEGMNPDDFTGRHGKSETAFADAKKKQQYESSQMREHWFLSCFGTRHQIASFLKGKGVGFGSGP